MVCFRFIFFVKRQAAARALGEAQKGQRAARAAERAARQTNGEKAPAPAPARPYVKRANENKRKSVKELSPLQEGDEESPATSEESPQKKAKKLQGKGNKELATYGLTLKTDQDRIYLAQVVECKLKIFYFLWSRCSQRESPGLACSRGRLGERQKCYL